MEQCRWVMGWQLSVAGGWVVGYLQAVHFDEGGLPISRGVRAHTDQLASCSKAHWHMRERILLGCHGVHGGQRDFL